MWSFIREKFFTLAKRLQNITQRDLGGDDAINCFWRKLVHKSGFKALTPDRANCGYGWVAHWVHVLISEMLAKFRKVTKKRCGWCDVGGCGHCRGLWLSVVPVQEDGKRRRGRRRLRLNCPPPTPLSPAKIFTSTTRPVRPDTPAVLLRLLVIMLAINSCV